MKIAIPTNDGINIFGHFGRCREFLIFEAGNESVELIETRANAGCHERGEACGAVPARHHNHAGFVEVLGDCATVLCGGIGAGAVEALRSGGIQVAIVEAVGNAEQIVRDFHGGALTPVAASTCQCQH